MSYDNIIDSPSERGAFSEISIEHGSLSTSQQILCREENARIRLATVRHAMLGQLREPTPG